MHDSPHDSAGKTVKIKRDVYPLHGVPLAGQEFRLEDWWDRLGQGSWLEGQGNIACVLYATRVVHESLPLDEEVVYGKIGNFGHLIHVSEIEVPETK